MLLQTHMLITTGSLLLPLPHFKNLASPARAFFHAQLNSDFQLYCTQNTYLYAIHGCEYVRTIWGRETQIKDKATEKRCLPIKGFNCYNNCSFPWGKKLKEDCKKIVMNGWNHKPEIRRSNLKLVNFGKKHLA